MANFEHAFFYPSENHDRVYDSTSFEYWIKKFFTTGVFTGDLQVKEKEGMTVIIAPGYINIGGKVKPYEQDQDILLETAHATYDRIDTIVIERNDSVRDFLVKVITGGYSSNPQPPVPIRESGIDQRVLAQIRVNHGAVRITQADITDTRADPELCGIVAGTVKEMDFSQFQAQFDRYFQNYKDEVAERYKEFTAEIKRLEDAGQASYNNLVELFESFTADYRELFLIWFNDTKGQLSEDPAGKLQNEVNDIVDGVASRTQTKTTVFEKDGSIKETLADGRYKTTVFEKDGSITEAFWSVEGEKLWENVTTFLPDGSIKEERKWLI